MIVKPSTFACALLGALLLIGCDATPSSEPAKVDRTADARIDQAALPEQASASLDGASSGIAPVAESPVLAKDRLRESRFREGRDYELLQPRQATSTGDGRVEVAEIFQYGCLGCYRFEPHLEQWARRKAEDIDFIRIPAIWNPLGELHAQAFYTAETLGLLEATHAPFFDAFHADGNHLESESKLRAFFARFGVDAERFNSVFDSFAVHAKMQRAKDLATRYGIPETPSIVVNGRYLTRGQLAQSYERWFEIVDELADRERHRE